MQVGGSCREEAASCCAKRILKMLDACSWFSSCQRRGSEMPRARRMRSGQSSTRRVAGCSEEKRRNKPMQQEKTEANGAPLLGLEIEGNGEEVGTNNPMGPMLGVCQPHVCRPLGQPRVCRARSTEPLDWCPTVEVGNETTKTKARRRAERKPIKARCFRLPQGVSPALALKAYVFAVPATAVPRR